MTTLKKLTFSTLLFVGFSVFAQSTPPNPNPPPPGLPIDGFLWFGILVAIGYGVYVYLERSRKKHNPSVSSSAVEVPALSGVEGSLLEKTNNQLGNLINNNTNNPKK